MASRTLLFAGVLLTSAASAQPLTPANPHVAARAPPPVSLADYDQPARRPDVLNHIRAIANLSFQNWAIWQLSWFREADWVPVTRESLGDNLRHGFAFDVDELQTNFLGHPYHGGFMFTSARAAGLGFWTSVPYTFAGSLSWEMFAENEPPSINDLMVTTLGGIMLGEISYRLSSALLDDGSSGGPRLLRELGAALVSPIRGFNRLYTGEAWQSGPSPLRRPLEIGLEVGVEHMRARDGAASGSYPPTLLLAADVSYGWLRPLESPAVLEPFELFELDVAVNLLNSKLDGAQVYTTALLYGQSLESSALANRVLGFAMTYDFQGSNLTTYGGVGVGPAYFAVAHTGPRQWLRLSAGIDLVPIFGVTSVPNGNARPYDFGTGVALWASLRWDFDRFGTLRLRTRQYAARVMDGVEGVHYVATARLCYEVDALPGLGAGIAPLLVYQRRMHAIEDTSAVQLQAQLYLRLHL
jgi:hypothetical protein